MTLSLEPASLQAAYLAGAVSPVEVVKHALAKIEANRQNNVWIHRIDEEDVLSEAKRLEQVGPNEIGKYPLYGLPFAVKDCIDVAGEPTTSACPEFSYVPTVSAPAVAKLVAAGAICLGKTNMDQFATGLVGIRSPYGTPVNPFAPDYIPGGSSSGSAVAVAGGLVSFALGTDTGGSGRVPASYTNTVGLKPTKGLISTRGLVHACRTLDCVSIYALTPGDAQAVLEVVQEGATHAAARAQGLAKSPYRPNAAFAFGLPRKDQMQFFGDRDSEALFGDAVDTLQRLGGVAVRIDFGPMLEVTTMFRGPYVAERLASVGLFLRKNPGAGHPTVRSIIEDAARFTAVDVFSMLYRLAELKERMAALWSRIDVLVLPTVGRPYRIAEVVADPITLNKNTGYYTSFANPLDFAVLAVPNGFHPCGVPMGITLNGPAFSEDYLVGLGTHFLAASARRS